MTASKTGRLGLMSPTGSDAFVVGDFSDTFGKLDASPGVPPIPNAAARPSTYTSAQHGSQVFQTDLGIDLWWNQPTSGVAGQWVRKTGQGFLAQYVNSGTVSTSTRTYASGPNVVSGSVTLGGGRPIVVMLSWDRLDNDNGRNVVSYWENGTRVYDKFFFGYTGDVSAGTFWVYRNPAPSTGGSVSFAMTIAAYNASSPNGGGTTTMGNGIMSIFEL